MTSLRRVLLLAVLLAAPISVFGQSFTCTPPMVNPIVCENSMTGSPQTEWDISGYGDASIMGFAGSISVNAGQTQSFKINTTASSYTMAIYRLGYYGGMGARKVATITPSAKLPQTQPSCLTDSSTGLFDCGNWGVSASWDVPSSATSGVYIALLTRSDTGAKNHIVFVVRNDSSTSNLVFQTSDTTWEAYNFYGGSGTGAPLKGQSLHGCNNQWNDACRAFKVSYNRPFDTRGSIGGPMDWVFSSEYPMIRWLEANGYDMTYISGADTDQSGSLLLNHKVFLSVGHDEHWSASQRANVEAARAAGVNLAFFSGNEIFSKTRWESSISSPATAYRTLVSYQETKCECQSDPLDPSVWTGTWRDPAFSPPDDGGRPENSLSGTLYMVNAYRTDPLVVPQADGRMRFWRSTQIAALQAGQSYTTAAGLLGDAWDSDSDNGSRPAGLFRLSTSTYNVNTLLLDHGNTYGTGSATHNLTLYRYSSGALIFGAGTSHWSWGLDATHDQAGTPADANLQQATVNLMADMGVQPGALQGGLLLASKSTDTTPPSSVITSPANGSSVVNGITIITGTAADSGGGVVGGVEVSVDGGTTWRPTTGRESWAYAFQPAGLGTVKILSRAVDDSGNLENPSPGIAVNIVSSSGSTSGAQTFNAALGQSVTTQLAQVAVTNSYDLWIDFESDTVGSTITAAQLAQSSHGATGSWSAGSTLMTAQTASQDPGDPGTRGMQYSSTSGAKGSVTYSLPVSKSTVSIGLWYKTGASYAYAEGPHFMTFYNEAYGDLMRLADERDGVDNQRQIRVSPDNSGGTTGRITGLSDNTWYWVTMKFVKGATGNFSVYNTALQLLGATTYTDTSNQIVNSILLGNSQLTSPADSYKVSFDDFVMDSTNANFPLMPPNTVVNSTSTAVVSAPNPSTFGQSVTFTATVTSTAGVPSGTVAFTDGATTLASAVSVNSSGVATFSTTALAAGSHTITAAFTGGTGWQNSSATAAAQVVQGATSTSVSSAPNPSTPGQSVTFTATITSTAGVPAGTVTFKDGTTTLASAVVVNSSGIASFSTSALAAGSHTIAATFTGNTGWLSSTGTAPAQVVQGASTATAVTPAPNPSTAGQSVTFTATVTSSAGVPSGTITFTDGATTLASGVVVNASGIATFSSSTLAVGSHTITAAFTGNSGWQNSSGTAAAQVVQGATTTAVTSTPNPSTFGQSVSFTATISSGSGVPSGTVTFSEGATVLASNVAVSAGKATFSTTALTLGSHVITGTFTGTNGWLGSTGVSPSQVVQAVIVNSYDDWTDFESDTVGSAMTAAQLAQSSHGSTGTWSSSQQAGLLTTQAASQDPGDPGTRGMQYSTPNGAKGFIQYTLPTAKSSVSVGLWYKMGASYSFSEGPHFMTFSNVSFGDTMRLADERDSLDNQRQIRISPDNSGGVEGRVTGLSDNTWYWVTMKIVQGSTGSFSVYDTSLNLIGTTTYTDSTNAITTSILLGNSQQTAPSHAYTISFDDFVMDSTTANFPLIPPGTQIAASATSTAVTSAPNPSTFGQSVTFTASVTSSTGIPSGTVTFTDGATTLASGVAVNSSGVASFSTTTLASGSHTITAAFTGGAGWLNSSGTAAAQVVQSATSTAVTSTANPSTFGQSVTFTATVSSSGGVPTGTFAFTDGATTLASGVAVNGSGIASFSSTTLAVGSHTITAAFTGGAGWQNSSGTAAAQIVQSATTTAVTSSPNPSTSGQSVTFTATVTSSAGVPTGTVTFTDGATTLASGVAVNAGGVATFSTTTLTIGSHTITATFTGSNGWQNSSGTAGSQLVQGATSTTVTSAPNPSAIGQSVTFTATVTSSGGVPTGTVTFTDGATTLASGVAVNGSGVATFSTTTLASGSNTIIAAFTGSNGWQNSSGTSSAQMVLTATATAVTSAPDPSTFGQSVTFTATITSSAGVPTGTVKFTDGVTTLASGVVVNSSGIATFSTTTLAAGSHTITASFTDGTTWAGSTGTAAAQVVQGVTATAVTSTSNPSGLGQSVTFTATVTSSAGVPAGTVKFTDGAATLASGVAVNASGVATFSTTTLAAGAHTITAAFTGSIGWQNSSSVSLTQSVLNATNTAVASSPNPSTFGQSVTFTATITSGSGVPTGTVKFTDGATTLASAVVVNGSGIATFSTTTLAAGSHTITGTFTDGTTWAGSSGTAAAQIVQGVTNTAVTSTPNPATFGQSITFTATVTSSAGVPSGTVKFTDGATTLASGVAVNGSGIAIFTTTTLAVGSHTIIAAFTGNTGWQNSSGTATAQSVQGTTTTAVVASPNPAAPGQSVTLTATITSSAGVPAGTVTFTDGSTTLASNVAVNSSGKATFSTSTLSVASHTIKTAFTGSTGWQASSGTTTLVVQVVGGATSTAATSTPNPSTTGQSVTFTATVSASAGAPTGTVTFTDGSTTLTSGVAVNASGIATFSTTTLAVGSHTITATFTGTGGWLNSSGTATTAQVVNAASSYNLWIDFESDTIGSALTAAQMTQSSHGATGTWDDTQQAGIMTTQSAAQSPSSTGTRGMQYSSTTGAVGFVDYAFPVAKSSVSIGWWYKTGASYDYAEGPHFMTFYNDNLGEMMRLSDERDSSDNQRQIRVSPGNSGGTTGRITGIKDNTWYWVTMKFVQGSSGQLSVYDASLHLVGTTTYTDTSNVVAQYILLGNSQETSPTNSYTVDFDDFIMDTTTANFPLMPPL